MIKILVILSILTGAGAVKPAQAAPVSGTVLLERCTAPKSDEAAYDVLNSWCLGFVAGIADSFDCKQPIGGGFLWKPPPNSNAGQFQKVVVKWLISHPEHLHLLASSLVAAALSEAFPCN